MTHSSGGRDKTNVLVFEAGGERFIFLWDDLSLSQLLQTFGRYAADPELNFSWHDAAALSRVTIRRAKDRDDLAGS